MKKPTYLLLSLWLLAACQNTTEQVDPNAELSAVIGGQVFTARPRIPDSELKAAGVLSLWGQQGEDVLRVSFVGISDQSLTAEFDAPGLEVFHPANQNIGGQRQTPLVTVIFTNAAGETWASMTPPEGSGGQLIVTKASREELVGEFSGTLWGPIRLDRDDWKDPRNLRPLKIEKGVVRVRAALPD
jgi:hypothetical protein